MSKAQGIRFASHRSVFGSWDLVERLPHPSLAPYVRRYAGYLETSGHALRRRQTPSGDIALIINFGAPFRIIDDGGRATALVQSSFVAGLHDAYALVDSAGRAHCLQVDFSPIGAQRFFGIAMDRLACRTVAFEQVLGNSANHLVERLQSAPNWKARFAILDSEIAYRMSNAKAHSPRVDYAWRCLEATGGAVRIAALCAELACSRGHLARCFRDQIGLPPKTVARIFRYRRAVGLLSGGAFGSVAAVAADCGYADQSHMVKDFRQFAGYAPTDYVKAPAPGGGLIDP